MARALITGGTVGIGHSFARALAQEGYDLVLASRDLEGLKKVAEQFREEFAVDVEVIQTDLAERDNVARLAQRIESVDSPIDLLVNNAGFAVHDSLLVEDVSAHDRAFEVMCRAVLVLSGAAGRAMKTRGHGGIINVSSSSTVITTGNYSAMKAWVTVYTEGLANELRGTGVKVMAVLPGWVKTEFHSRGGVKAHNLPDIVWIDSDVLATQALKHFKAGKVLSVPTAKWRFAVGLGHILPRRTIRWMSRKLSKSRQ
ncbi:MAG: SDR family NAD(P)-dependent oxidoreductase [Propionibacteriaceae bacterium]|jgi:short-subunit dehydrogenase|nr:SDR family NAD(P)-dependent oxidoreductase [Propionibacteriaceae bacterium]